MRIYEFAQLHNVSSKDIIEKLHQGSFDVKSHMSLLDDKALSFLEGFVNKANIGDENIEHAQESLSINPIENKVTELSPTTSKQELSHQEHQQSAPAAEKKHSQIEIVPHQMGIIEFAEKIKKPVTDIIVTLLK